MPVTGFDTSEKTPPGQECHALNTTNVVNIALHLSCSLPSILRLAWMPTICWYPYVPQLNVVEYGWGHTKYGERANCMPNDATDLAHTVAASLMAKHQHPNLLRAFCQHAQLRL
jgi:hypothetical protein